MRWRFACITIILVSGIVYLRALGGSPIWDDHDLLDGLGIGSAHNLLQCFTRPFLFHYYRPLTSASFYLNRSIGGMHPFGYHLVNLALHLLTTAVLIAMLQAAFRSRSIALIGGALFAVQPAQVSAVAWIGGRTDSLCTFWMALFAWTLILAAQAEGSRRVGLLAASGAAYFAALLSKEQALAALPLVPLAFYCFRSVDAAPWRRAAGRASIAFIVLTLVFLGMWHLLGPSPVSPPRHAFGGEVSLVGRTLTYYALLLLAPAPKWMHTVNLVALQRVELLSVCGGFAILGMIGIGIWRWRRRAPAAAWFLVFTLLSLLPVSNLIPVPTFSVAPYRAGVAGLGIAALLGWIVGIRGQWLVVSDQKRLLPRHRPLFTWVAGAAYAAWCLGLTLWGVTQWQNEVCIGATLVRYDPESPFAQVELASALLDAGKLEAATIHLDTVLAQLSGQPLSKLTGVSQQTPTPIHLKLAAYQEWLARLYARVGIAQVQKGDQRGALRSLQIAQRIDQGTSQIRLEN